jgi:hypothetical protein
MSSPRTKRRGGGGGGGGAKDGQEEDAVPIAEMDSDSSRASSSSSRLNGPATAAAAAAAPEPAAGKAPATAAASMAVVALSSSSRPGGVPLGNYWFLRNGRGKMRTAAGKDGGASITTVSDVMSGAFYLATYEPSQEDLNECIWRGSFQLDVSCKCVREPTNSTPSFYIVVDAQLNAAGGPENFCVIVLDTKLREVRVERFTTTGNELLAHRSMQGLRAGIWYRIHAEVHGKAAKIYVNGELLLDGVELDAGGGGLLGMALYQAKGQFRGWEVKQLNAAMMRRVYTGEDDPKLVEMIDRDIISQVGVQHA